MARHHLENTVPDCPKQIDAAVNFEQPQTPLPLRSDKYPYNACPKTWQNVYSTVIKQSREDSALI